VKGAKPQRRSRTTQACVAPLLFLCLVGCAASDQNKWFDGLRMGTHGDPTDAVRNADLSSRSPVQSDPSTQSKQLSQPLLFPGSEPPSAPPKRNPDERVASLNGVALSGDGVEMNFESADIQTVARTLLGDVLQLNFVVDPRIQGNITLASASPIPRKNVLPVFESVLRMSNAAIVHDGNLVKIVPVADASGNGTVSSGAGEPGFGVSVVPLRYTSAATVARMAENFLSRPGSIRADQSRNLLLIQGTTLERESALDVIATFDVEWLRNRSVGVYPLKSTAPETIISELERIFETSDGGQGQGVVSFQPISRMNAVMAVSKNAKFLERVTMWVNRLDRSDSTGTTVRVYTVKNGSAPRLARILNDIFVAQRGGTLDTPANQIAPGAGANTVQSRLDSIDKSANTAAASRAAPSASGMPSSRGMTPIAAAFESFASRKDSAEPQGTTSLSSPGGAPSGVFQNVRISADATNNSLVIYSNQEDYRIIERALRDIDRVQLQVSIDATIAEVDLTDELQYGIQHFLTSAGAGLGGDKGSTMFSAAQSVAQTAFLQRVLPGYNLLLGPEAQPRFILNALSTITHVKVLSAPSLVALDNQPAILQVGDEVPISTGTATVLTNSNTPIVNTIEMRDTGVILKVLPHVHSNGIIDVEVEQEISNVNPTQQTLTPTISQRRIHSTISVASGQTVLLGGLISERDESDRSGIPGLNQIKILGDLFGGGTTSTKQRTELIVFIKPKVIRNGLDARNVTEEFRERLATMRPGRTFVEGADVESIRKR
jgi:general secretion pathway protein D